MAFKPTHGLLVRDWKQDVINLVQFPRCGCIVSTSPFAIKLETFIRFNKLNYVVSFTQPYNQALASQLFDLERQQRAEVGLYQGTDPVHRA
jgi:hypothetical protein